MEDIPCIKIIMIMEDLGAGVHTTDAATIMTDIVAVMMMIVMIQEDIMMNTHTEIGTINKIFLDGL